MGRSTESRKRAIWGLATVGLAALLGFVTWRLWPGRETDSGLAVPVPAPPNPQLVYQGPFQNIRPEVPYVGDAACAGCHKDIADAYKSSAMGRSMRPIAEVAPLQQYDDSTNNPFELLGYRFHVDRQGNRVWHRQSRSGPGGEPLLDFSLEAQYVIGSGTRGYSYLTDRDGFLFQTPISWFSQKGIWDKSPGFVADRFSGRPITETCLYCHTNRAPAIEGYTNRYDRPFGHGYAIGCERCHGPGDKHVREGGVLTEGFDPTIVNPRKLPDHGLREAICQQCHLEGKARIVLRGRRLDEFRPGLPLDSFLATFVIADEPGVKAVSHVEQMYHSGCFLGGQGTQKMGCTSCHDPHRQVPAGERVAFYRARCLKCHETHGCSAAPVARAQKHDSCVDCHMPRFQSSDIVHTASTDHRVIRPGKTKELTPAEDGRIELFHAPLARVPDKERSRDLGMAQVQFAGSDTALLERGLALLETAGTDFPDDLPGLEMRGYALLTLGRPGQAAQVLRQVLDQAPDREMALLRYATACEAMGLEKPALDSWQRSAELNPWLPIAREHLAALLTKAGAWKELQPHAEAWLRLEPGNVNAHKAWITALVRNGRGGEARRALARARALHPFNQSELQAWFEEIQP